MSPIVTGEVEKVIADANRLVVDPVTLTTREILAGQPVPPDLVDAEDAGKSIVAYDFEGAVSSEPAKVGRARASEK